MEIQIIRDKISNDELKIMMQNQFGNVIKAVVDIKQEIMAVGGYTHEEERQMLLNEARSKFEDLWGINIYPERFKKSSKDFVEFDSSVNIRPSFGSKGIYDPKIQSKIKEIIDKLIKD